jgi:glycosyltransferase involved in cell wall biosynthesis
MFVFPSFYEGHGFPVAEAMASGTPVITSNTSSLREIGENAAVLVDPENVNDLYRAMDALFTNKDLRDELSGKGRDRAAQFSLKNAAEAVLHIYESFE